MMDGASGYVWMKVNSPVTHPTSSTRLVFCSGSVRLRVDSSSLSSKESFLSRTNCRSNFCARRRFLCIRLAIASLFGFLISPRPGLEANLPKRPDSELLFVSGLEVMLLNSTGKGGGLASGVSSLSVGASGDELSGGDEKSMSKGFLGVVNEGVRNGDC